MIWVFIALWALTLLGFFVACIKIENLQAELRDGDKADHAKCIAHIASVTSNRMVASGLRRAADKWDSVEEQATLAQLARERYTPGGPSMPTIWLRREADLILGYDPDAEPVYNFAGERVR